MLTIEKIIEAVQNAAKEYPIRKVDLFGSYAKETQTERSDVDFIVEFETSAVSLIMLSSLKYKLEEDLNVSVDLIHGPLGADALLMPERIISIFPTSH